MNAGRELDALVAEKVMGFVWDESRCRVCGWKFGNCLPDNCSMRPSPSRRADDPVHYSTDIAAAWEVHLNICDRLFSVRLRYFEALQEQTRDRTNMVAWPDVLVVLRFRFPEAICLAALKAVSA